MACILIYGPITMRTLKIFISILIFILSASVASAFQMSGCGEDCASCHALSKDEASKLIRAQKYRSTVEDIKMSAVKGLWELQVKKDGKVFPVYVDFSKKYLVEARFTQLDSLDGMEPTKPAKPELQKLDRSQIPLDDSIIIGQPDAKNKIIVFSDPDCPSCKKLHEEIKQIIAERKDIAFYIKLFPLEMHPDAYRKSKLIQCSQCSQSPALLDDAFTGKNLTGSDCDTQIIDNNMELGKRLGIRGTPAIILPDGSLVRGYVQKDKLYELLDNKG